MVYWLAELKNPEHPVALSDEHEHFEWCSLDAALNLSKYPDMQAVLREAEAYIKSKPHQ